jgi:hypothetical protein
MGDLEKVHGRKWWAIKQSPSFLSETTIKKHQNKIKGKFQNKMKNAPYKFHSGTGFVRHDRATES